MTSSKRLKVHHLCEKLGYHKILEMKELEAPVLDEACSAFQYVRADETPVALKIALAATTLSSNNGFFDLGWNVVQLTGEILADIQRRSMAYWWCGREGLLLTWEIGGGKTLGIGMPACAMETLPDLLLDVRRLAAGQGYADVFWIAPLRDEILSAAQAAGFIHHREHDNYLYEKHHLYTGTSPTRP